MKSVETGQLFMATTPNASASPCLSTGCYLLKIDNSVATAMSATLVVVAPISVDRVSGKS